MSKGDTSDGDIMAKLKAAEQAEKEKRELAQKERARKAQEKKERKAAADKQRETEAPAEVNAAEEIAKEVNAEEIAKEVNAEEIAKEEQPEAEAKKTDVGVTTAKPKAKGKEIKMSAAAKAALKKVTEREEAERQRKEAEDALRKAEEEFRQIEAERHELEEAKRLETSKKRKVRAAEKKKEQDEERAREAACQAEEMFAGRIGIAAPTRKSKQKKRGAETMEEIASADIEPIAAEEEKAEEEKPKAKPESWEAWGSESEPEISTPPPEVIEEDSAPATETPAPEATKMAGKQKKGEKKTDLLTAELRAPICCVLGHVDTGKTKLLDKIRHTSVQEKEAGGITQQIGATWIPPNVLDENCGAVLPNYAIRVPGLLIIDTPGHESFNNLRKRGSSLCDIAVLVVDIMHGLEKQTLESLSLLRSRNCPFIIALNKVDRCYQWTSTEWAPARRALEAQGEATMDDFDRRWTEAKVQLAEQGLNTDLHWRVTDPKSEVSVIPTSAMSGEGIPDLISLLVKLPQERMTATLVKTPRLECIVLEVKHDEEGCSIDVILISGSLRQGQRVVLCSMDGPIETKIRALRTPHPLKEMRVKNQYIDNKEIQAAIGVKIIGNNLDTVLPGTQLFSLPSSGAKDEIARQTNDLKAKVMADFNEILSQFDKSDKGVYVMARTLGSLEAVVEFLRGSNVPVLKVNLGQVQKKDVITAATMREKHPQYCAILAFDTKCDEDIARLADENGVKIFSADIIYHLLDQYAEQVKIWEEKRRKENAHKAIFPCEGKVIELVRSSSPLIIGIKIERGSLRNGTPLIVKENDSSLGRVASMEINNRPIETAKPGQEVCVKMEGSDARGGKHVMVGNSCLSRISRESIDALKEFFSKQVTKEEWYLVMDLKKQFSIL